MPEHAAPTQIRYPSRATIRTAFQIVVALAAMFPLLVNASGLDATAGWLVLAAGIAAGITRIMALPVVEAFLQRYVPWLAARPAEPGA